jgi:hypothetical protein
MSLTLTTGCGVIHGSVDYIVRQSTPRAEDYTKEKALARAKKEFALFLEKYKLSAKDFDGPKISTGVGLDFPTYKVCYESKKCGFCYNHWTNHALQDCFLEFNN